MGRSLRKGPYVDERLLAKVEKQQRGSSREPLKTWSRDCTVVPDFIGHTFLVHNGRQFTEVVRDGRHGRPQARRILPDPPVPRSFGRQGQGGGPGQVELFSLASVRRPRDDGVD